MLINLFLEELRFFFDIVGNVTLSGQELLSTVTSSVFRFPLLRLGIQVPNW